MQFKIIVKKTGKHAEGHALVVFNLEKPVSYKNSKSDKMCFSTKVCNTNILMRHICKFCMKLSKVSSDFNKYL